MLTRDMHTGVLYELRWLRLFDLWLSGRLVPAQMTIEERLEPVSLVMKRAIHAERRVYVVAGLLSCGISERVAGVELDDAAKALATSLRAALAERLGRGRLRSQPVRRGRLRHRPDHQVT
jgi:hypothetical protein